MSKFNDIYKILNREDISNDAEIYIALGHYHDIYFARAKYANKVKISDDNPSEIVFIDNKGDKPINLGDIRELLSHNTISILSRIRVNPDVDSISSIRVTKWFKNDVLILHNHLFSKASLNIFVTNPDFYNIMKSNLNELDHVKLSM